MSDTNNNLRPSSMADSEKTATPSVQHAVVADEKKGTVETVIPATGVSEKVTEAATGTGTGLLRTDEKRISTASAGAEEDDFEYPAKWRLAAITIALCLSVFCMALVSIPISKSSSSLPQLRLIDKAASVKPNQITDHELKADNIFRTTRSSQQPSPA
jgi:hypothetical protein